MNSLRINLSTKLFSLCLILLCFYVSSSFARQSDETKRGIEFYNQGNDKEAIELLKAATKKNKQDIEAWHYLGLAFERSGKIKDAGKAYETASKEGIGMFISTYVEEGKSETRKSLLPQFKIALESINRHLSKQESFSDEKLKELNLIKETLEEYINFVEVGLTQSLGMIFSSKDLQAKARIIKNLPPKTDSMDEAFELKLIRVMAILGADGKVHFVVPLKKMSSDLTLDIIRTAKEIQFTPAIKDGKPTHQWINFEYNFGVQTRINP